MMGAIGANVLGNLVTAPLTAGTNLNLSSRVAGLTAGDYEHWQEYGWQSSEVPGAQVTLQGKTVSGVRVQTQAVRGEPVPVVPAAAPAAPAAEPAAPPCCGGERKAYNQTVMLPTEPEHSKEDKTPAPPPPAPPAVLDNSNMNLSMLVGAAAGAAVAKSAGYNLLLGAAAGALVGHFYAAGAYK